MERRNFGNRSDFDWSNYGSASHPGSCGQFHDKYEFTNHQVELAQESEGSTANLNWRGKGGLKMGKRKIQTVNEEHVPEKSITFDLFGDENYSNPAITSSKWVWTSILTFAGLGMLTTLFLLRRRF